MPMTGSLPLRDGETTGTNVSIDLPIAHAVAREMAFPELNRATNEFDSIPNEGYGSAPASIAAGALTDRIRDYTLANLKDLVQRLGGIDQVRAAAQLAYRTYVAPINIPQIPDFIEPSFDTYMEVAMGKIILKAWDRINA